MNGRSFELCGSCFAEIAPIANCQMTRARKIYRLVSMSWDEAERSAARALVGA
jgi:hypothetical protein